MVTWGQILEARQRAVPSVGHDRHRLRPDIRAMFEGPSMTAALQRRAVVASMLVALGLAGCGDSSSPGVGAESATLAERLCAIADTADDDPGAAAERFSTQVHGPLHDRIDALLEEDRAAASDLMDAKFAVESLAQEDDPPGDELRDALERLAAQLPDASGCQA